MFKLRPYQSRALDAARSAFAEGKKRSLIVAPTGAGKTVIACALMESASKKGRRTLFLAHRAELIEQTSRKLNEIGLEHGIIKAGIEDGRVRPDALVQVAAVQTLDRRRDEMGNYSVVIVDEAHHTNAESWARVIEATRYDALLGLTATPYRADGKALGDYFDKLVLVSSLRDLIGTGHLVEPRVYGREPPDLRKVERRGNDYKLEQLAQVMDRPALVEDIVKEWRRLAAGRTTVVFATSIVHSKHIVEGFVRAGVRAGHVDGEMAAEERVAVLQRLAAGDLDVVSNCQVLTEGWDLPRCSAVVLARPTQSRSLWKQMCGRALRPCPEVDKNDCLIIDHAGCWKRHGFLTDEEALSLEGREPRESSAPMRRCPSCRAQFPGWPRYCPECGAALPRGGSWLAEEPVLCEPPLVEVGTQRSERELFHRLLREARAAGHAPTRATGEYWRLRGQWPSNSIYPTDEEDIQIYWQANKGKKRLFWRSPIAQAAPVPVGAAHQWATPDIDVALRTSRSQHSVVGEMSVRSKVDEFPSRSVVRGLAACPSCFVRAGSACVGARGDIRKSNHIERLRAAHEMAQSVGCPDCGAVATRGCVGPFGAMKTVHPGRLRVALGSGAEYPP
ncbi:DEAD/DEAH box helicase family protein [Myxococcaceae bacterium JPH2]|nr:DEAD/DEAH box helicase family protein [Myxococcaceae bacterium JPH2]